MNETLFDPITVRCFWWQGGCRHTVTSLDPYAAHDQMERHYATTHRDLIKALVGG